MIAHKLIELVNEVKKKSKRNFGSLDIDKLGTKEYPVYDPGEVYKVPHGTDTDYFSLDTEIDTDDGTYYPAEPYGLQASRASKILNRHDLPKPKKKSIPIPEPEKPNQEPEVMKKKSPLPFDNKKDLDNWYKKEMDGEIDIGEFRYIRRLYKKKLKELIGQR